MRIVHLAVEFAPLAKVGGLAEVVHGLANALAALDHKVEVILPRYSFIDLEKLPYLHREEKPIELEGRIFWIWQGAFEGLSLTLIDPERGFGDKIYAGSDDPHRFTSFILAALLHLEKEGKTLDVLHAHDWSSALAIPLIQEESFKIKCKKTVLTIHNLEHQGRVSWDLFDRLPFKKNIDKVKKNLGDAFYTDSLNLLKGGIVYADAITTVSPTYSKEICTAEGGFGLDDILISYKNKLHGILNGINQESWDPETDPHLFYHLPKRFDQFLVAKKKNQTALRAELGLKRKAVPLIGAVTRLVSQKGPELILYGIEKVLELGGQFVLLGSTFDPQTHAQFVQAQKRFANSGNVHIELGQNEALAHQIFASSDMFFIPSRFEPCGLTQMVAMRYGSIPIVRKTGGLGDTVFDVQTATIPSDKRNGFTFLFPDSHGVDWAFKRAFALHTSRPHQWRSLIENARKANFSWRRSARRYLKIYQS